MKTLIFLLISLLVFSGCEPLLTPPAEVQPTAEIVEPSATLAPEALPTETPVPATETSIPQPTATSLPTNAPVPEEPTDIDPQEMVTIPAGTFLMGCDPANNAGQNCTISDGPAHQVSLDAFAMTRYEITNELYQACVEDGACEVPNDFSTGTRVEYYGNPDYANYPVVNVSHSDAKDYCTWAGMRLPTEAEWEYAARGTAGNLYPWGNEDPDCSLANSYNDLNGSYCVTDTTAVGSYSAGASEFGLMDMAGNAWEWVADFYSPDYYAQSPEENPSGPESGSEYVVRGGGWSGGWLDLRSSARAYDLSFYSGSDLGFRCAMDALDDAED